MSLQNIATDVQCFLCHAEAGPRCRMINDGGLFFIACARCAKQANKKIRERLERVGANT